MFQLNGDLEGAIRFSLFPSKLFGLFPFVETAGVYRLSPKAMLSSTAMCLVIFLFSLWNIYIRQSSNEELFNSMEIVVMNLVTIICLLEISKSIAPLKECFESLEGVEEGLKAVSQKTHFSRDFRDLVFDVGACCCIVCSRLYLLTWDRVWGDACEILVFALMLLQKIVLSHRFSGLLMVASDLLASCKNEIAVSRRHPPSSRVQRLQHLVELHSKLCLTALSLGCCQEKQVLAVVFSCLVLSITEAYRTIKDFTSDSAEILISVLNLCGIGLFFNLCNQIVRACKATSAQAKDFTNTLYQLVINDKTTLLSSNKKLRLHFEMRREIVFTACGFFTLDSTLIHSMVGAATTYLVILIQIEKKNSCSET